MLLFIHEITASPAKGSQIYPRDPLREPKKGFSVKMVLVSLKISEIRTWPVPVSSHLLLNKGV